MFLLTLLGITCKEVSNSLSIYGETKEIEVGENNWAYFNFNFGDFGHTVKVSAYANQKPVSSIYYAYGGSCPNENSTKYEDSYFYDHSSQNVNFGVYVTDSKTVQVSVLSAVRPITINSSIALIYGFFVFFSINILVASVLQYFFFKNSMDPREYLPQDDNK